LYRIAGKEFLNPTVARMWVEAPDVAAKAKAGQFVILRVDEMGERVPLTVAECDVARGTVGIIFQIVGSETMLLARKEAGGSIQDFVGPLGRPSRLAGIRKACVVGGGVGCAIAYPVARALAGQGSVVHTVAGFRSRDLVILEKEFRQISERLVLMTDDGSYGEKGLVTDALERLILAGEGYDEVIAIGPVVMMKFVSLATKKHGVRTTVSMNPIMVDGTGMCGCCRVLVNGEARFACVDGPDFDGHLVDFDNLMRRNAVYRDHEQEQAHACRLTGEEVRGA
jgi:ferredoxin--NADP+ reductase